MAVSRTTDDRAITFEVVPEFLDEARNAEWSDPVRYRFEKREDGGWDLVFRRDEP